MKMKDRNAQLKSTLGAMPTKERLVESLNVPKENTTNRSGCPAYSLADELRLISMLNTLKIQPQYYRSENETIKELRDLIEKIGLKDPYFAAQCIVYSRCLGEGMRTVNHLAAALLSPFISGQEYAKRFYSVFNKKTKSGGCILRPDDMTEIKDVYDFLNKGKLSNAMKKGFAHALESFDNYQLSKYRANTINIANLVHPDSKKSNAVITIDGKEMKTLDAIMKGITVTADTWEANNSEAGQIVADAVRSGKLDKDEAKKVLAEAKNDNWETMLKEGTLGILAALRNIRNMLSNPRKEVIDALCKLVQDGDKIRNGLIMPYQIDLAYTIIENEFPNCMYGDQIKTALRNGYIKAMPNLKIAMPGKTLCVVDTSGSMRTPCTGDKKSNRYYRRSAMYQAALMAATIAQATDGDIMTFSDDSHWYSFRKSDNVFSIAKDIENKSYCGGTNIPSVFKRLTTEKKHYDRIIILSDNECNRQASSSYSSYYYSNGKNWVSGAYAEYVKYVTSPYVYCVDLAAYGTTILPQNNKIAYYFGYGYSMLDDIAKLEFNPQAHIEKIKKIVI